MVFSAVM